MKRFTASHRFWLFPLWVLEGILAGFGAILPGVSGGALCVVFGMYQPIVELMSHPRRSLKQNGMMLAFFVLGIAVGFVGLAGVAAWLLDKNESAVTCAFVGFVLGTLPELWKDAGAQGRKKGSYLSLLCGFIGICGVLYLLNNSAAITIAPGFAAFILCGVLWGLSFIVPGLSSSSLLLFFGLYGPMSKGISTLDFSVLIPMGIGMLACVVLLSKAVGLLYQKQFSIASHAVLGFVAATAVMILPIPTSLTQGAFSAALIVGGAVLSFGFSKLCSVLKAKAQA